MLAAASRARRWAIATGVVALAGTAAVAGGALWFGGRWAAAEHRRVGPPPADLPARAVEFRSDSGDLLRGWFVPGAPRRGGVVLLHGSHETRRAMIGRARFLSRRGYAVLLFDFHAYGESAGARTSFGYGESRDAAAAVALLRSLAPDTPIAAIGFSLGGAACLLGDRPLAVDALVLEAVYTDIRDAVANRLRMRFGAAGPLLAPLLTGQLGWRWGIDAARLRPIDAIGRLRVPVLIIAGTEDPRATIEDSRRLFAAAPEPKQLWEVPGAAHVNFQRFAPRQYEEKVTEFLDRYLRAPSGHS